MWRDVIEGKLAPDDQLLEIGLAVVGATVRRAPHRERHLDRRNLAEVEIRAQMRDRGPFRPVAGLGIAFESLGQEGREALAGRPEAAPEARNGPDALVDLEPRRGLPRVGEIDIRAEVETCRLVLHGRRGMRDQIGVEQPLDLRPERAGGEFVLRGDDVERHHGIRLHPHHAAARPLDGGRMPLALRPQVASVADQDRGLFGERKRDLVRCARPDHEGDPEPLEGRGDVGQAFEEERVMPGIGLGIGDAARPRQAERDDDRKLELVRQRDGMVERRVPLRPHRLLHPVLDVTPALTRRHVLQDRDPGRLGHWCSPSWRTLDRTVPDRQVTSPTARSRRRPALAAGPRPAYPRASSGAALAHLVFVAPPYLGHMNPMAALARELGRRGHRATYAGIADSEPLARRAGAFDFVAIGRTTHPTGTLPGLLRRIARADGVLGLRGVIRDVAAMTSALLDDLPPVLREMGADAIVCDGTEAAGGLVAEHLGLPVITVANALPLNREPGVPPEFVGWAYDASPKALERNQAGHRVADLLMGRQARVIAGAAERWGLPARRTIAGCLSPLAQMSQLVSGLDFPRADLPEHFHYVGPLRDAAAAGSPALVLPPDDGRPLAYASLGTLFGGRFRTFRRIASAAKTLDLRLVLSHGGLLTETQAARLDGADVHAFVPQDVVFAKAEAAILNGGLNSVMDALARGVPIVALPMAFEQDAIASRLVRSGAGLAVGRWSRSAKRIAAALDRVLTEPAFRDAAGRLSTDIATAGGTVAAADIVEAVLRSGRSVTRADAAAFARSRASRPAPIAAGA